MCVSFQTFDQCSGVKILQLKTTETCIYKLNAISYNNLTISMYERHKRHLIKHVNFTLDQAVKVQSGNEDTALLFLYPRMYVGVGGQRHAPAALPGTHCTGV